MNDIQRENEKRSIQKREQIAKTVFPLLFFVAFVIPASLFMILPKMTRLAQTIASLNSCWLMLSFWLLFFLIVGLGITQIGPYAQRTQRQKERWLNEYGQQVHAVFSKHPQENALIIDKRKRIHDRDASFRRYLNLQDPQTAQLYAFCVNIRFSSALRNLSEGTLYPVQFDLYDPSFFVVPGM